MGLGDDIMTTSYVRKSKILYPEKQIAFTLPGSGRVYWSDVYAFNPWIYNPYMGKSQYNTNNFIEIDDTPGNRPYIKSVEPGRLIFNMNFSPDPGLIMFSSEEISRQNDLPEFDVVIEPHIKGTVSGRNKDWGWEHWQQLSNRLVSRGCKLYQIGPKGTRVLEGVNHVITHNFREALCILAKTKFLITTDGALHHAMAALEKPACVIWGGYSRPDILGYKDHLNIWRDEPRALGVLKDNEYARAAMDSIAVGEVIDRLQGYESWVSINEKKQKK